MINTQVQSLVRAWLTLIFVLTLSGSSEGLVTGGTRSGSHRHGAEADLPAPTGLTVQTNLLSSGVVSLSWLPVDGALTYEVLRAPTPEIIEATLLASNLTVLTFTDGQPPIDVNLHYWVRATDSEQAGPVSEPVVARQNVLRWTWTTSGSLTAPVLLTNGWVAVGVNRRGPLDRPPNLGHIYALDFDGVVAWAYDATSTGLAQPVVNSMGHLVVGIARSNTNLLLTLSSHGAFLSETVGGPTGGFLAVSHDGTVFLLGRSVALSPQIQAYDSSGTLLWARGIATGPTAPRFAIHPDGSLLASAANSLVLYDSTGQALWSIGGFNLSWGEPAWAGPDRAIAINSRQELISFHSDGTPSWTNRLATSGTPAGVAVANSGACYVTGSGSMLYAFDAEGEELWNLPVGDATPYTPVLDHAGRILVATASAIVVVNADGVLSHQIFLPAAPTQAPVLTSDGSILVVMHGQLKVYRHSHGLSEDAPWPMSRRDVRGSSAATFAPIPKAHLEVRLNGTEAILRITASPPTVRVMRSLSLSDWVQEAELTTTGLPIDWTIPSDVPQPAFFRAIVP